ncbi:DUF6087 family protein [Streptomyces sp. NBC_00838]|uniref:DUF6087 family protein n=1 Tax=Streptomyces sp. NBC_00838 TaxID=2903680 RepID=UPI00386530CE|nr:DUF6087 family protein [Streptomyces sp. NBC_00838]
MQDEESLEELAWRLEVRRNASIGKLRAVPLTEGPHRGAHVEPTVPRAIEEWDGYRWVAVGVVDHLVAAQSLLNSPAEKRPVGWGGLGLGKGQGRHRTPNPADEQDR